MKDFDAYYSRGLALLLLGVFAAFIVGIWMGGGFGALPALRPLHPLEVFLVWLPWITLFGVAGVRAVKRLFGTSAPLRALSISEERLPDYTPRSYDDLKARSLVLAAAIEGFAAKLPPLTEYAPARPPTVKWIFLPNCRGDLNDWDNNVEACYFKLEELCYEVMPDLEFTNMGEDYGSAFWVWDDIRPSVKWVNDRLPQIYLLARACDCNLEGWTFEDDYAWEFGLSKAIEEAGFDRTYTRPGQMS